MLTEGDLNYLHFGVINLNDLLFLTYSISFLWNLNSKWGGEVIFWVLGDNLSNIIEESWVNVDFTLMLFYLINSECLFINPNDYCLISVLFLNTIELMIAENNSIL
jgi:hypothetical protein